MFDSNTTFQPLFSVLIAQYNNAQYLKECIESVYAQTYSYWEIIIVDDKSTDNSETIYRELESDSPIHIYKTERNKGCGFTKRRCVEMANGEICGFLDPDDTLTPNALQWHAEVHVNHSDVSVCFSNCNNCDKDLNIINVHKVSHFEEGQNFLTSKSMGTPTHFTSFKSSYYQQTPGIACYHSGIDQDLNLKLEEVGKIYVLDQMTYNWRFTGASLSRGDDQTECWYWNIKVLNDACERRNIDSKEWL